MNEPETGSENKPSPHSPHGQVRSDTKIPPLDWDQLMADMERPELYYKRPGRFRRWEIGDIIDRHGDFRVMEDGMTSDGTRLYAVYRRDREQHQKLQLVLNLGADRSPVIDPDTAEPSALPATSPTPLPSTEPSSVVPQTIMLLDPVVDPKLRRMPGLFVRWELEFLLETLEPRAEYHIERSGTLMDGSDLFAVFHTQRAAKRGG